MLEHDFVAALELAQQSVEITLQAGIMTQIVVTLILAASLKAMWNLLNVVQVLAYMRFYARWPAFMGTIFLWMDNAVTLKPVSDSIFDYGKSKFEIANQTLSDEGLRSAGVSDPKLVKGLGIFALALLVLLLGVGLHFVLSLGAKAKCIRRFRRYLRRRLFFNGFLRYMIVSNLKLTILAWGFFFATYGAQSSQSTLYRAGCIAGIVFLLVYPFCLMVCLLKHQGRMEEPDFRFRFSTVFDGIETDSKQALLLHHRTVQELGVSIVPSLLLILFARLVLEADAMGRSVD